MPFLPHIIVGIVIVVSSLVSFRIGVKAGASGFFTIWGISAVFLLGILEGIARLLGKSLVIYLYNALF